MSYISNDSNGYDVIFNPRHYTEGRKYEPRKVIEDWKLNFYLGNALKYIARAGRKDSAIEDLNKAKKYIDFEIERISNSISNTPNSNDNYDNVVVGIEAFDNPYGASVRLL